MPFHLLLPTMECRKRRLTKHKNVLVKATPVTAASSGSNALDFRAPSDDGWYGVRVAMDSKEKLRVTFAGFSKEYDELYAVDSFMNEEEINEFASRFRPISLQLQDSDCHKVIEGMHVCASLQPSDQELRFHDAAVDSVKFSEHDFIDGEEICNCTFTILWLHGPMVGQKTSTGIERICLHQPLSSQMDPALEHFLHEAKMRLEQQIKRRAQRTHNRLILPEELEILRLERRLKDTPGSTLLEMTQDQDLGGGPPLNNIDREDSYPIIEIKNLAKNISIQEVANTVHQHTSICSEIILNPGLHEKSAIFYPENWTNALTIYEFLRGPGYHIMSSRGRSWFVNEKRYSVSAKKQPCNRTREISNKIKFLLPGTEGYERGRQVRAAYIRSIFSKSNPSRKDSERMR